MAKTNPLATIRNDLEAYIGQKIMLKANRGRKKAIERTGVLEQTYPSHFLIRIDEESFNRRLSFSYADVLTETVELTLFKPDSEEKVRFQFHNRFTKKAQLKMLRFFMFKEQKIASNSININRGDVIEDRFNF